MDVEVSAVLPPCQISSLNLKDFSAGKPLAILCYPYDFLDDQCDEIKHFAAHYNNFKELNVEVRQSSRMLSLITEFFDAVFDPLD